jgi:hypothetical protein
MTIGWVVSLMVTSAASVEQTSNSTNASYITSRLGSDLKAAVDCNPYGLDVPFYSFSPSQIAFYERVGVTTTSLSQNSASISTSLSSGASVGATSISVVGTTGLVVGQTITIGNPSGVNDQDTISGIGSNSVSLSHTLTHTYFSGTAVNAPAASLSVASAAGITPGTRLAIGTGATQETATVSYASGNTVQLLGPLSYNHTSGESVTFPGGIALVAWRVSNGLLQRAVVSGVNGSCAPGNFAGGYANPTWVTVASGVTCQLTTTSGENCVTGSPSDPVYFQGYSGGQLQSGGTIASPLDCTGAGAGACYFSDVLFSADLTNPGGSGTTLKFSQQFSVNLSGSRLSS